MFAKICHKQVCQVHKTAICNNIAHTKNINKITFQEVKTDELTN